MLRGDIIHGDGIGRKYGFPTANLDCKATQGIGEGVYAGKVYIGDEIYKSAVAIKINPWKVEAHLLDFPHSDIYGSHAEIELLQKVSEMERYDNIEELKQKIRADIELVQHIFEDIS